MTSTRHATALTALLLVTTAQAVAQQAPLDLYRQAREHLIDERLTEALPLFQQIVSATRGASGRTTRSTTSATSASAWSTTVTPWPPSSSCWIAGRTLRAPRAPVRASRS